MPGLGYPGGAYPGYEATEPPLAGVSAFVSQAPLEILYPFGCYTYEPSLCVADMFGTDAVLADVSCPVDMPSALALDADIAPLLAALQPPRPRPPAPIAKAPRVASCAAAETFPIDPDARKKR